MGKGAAIGFSIFIIIGTAVSLSVIPALMGFFGGFTSSFSATTAEENLNSLADSMSTTCDVIRGAGSGLSASYTKGPIELAEMKAIKYDSGGPSLIGELEDQKPIEVELDDSCSYQTSNFPAESEVSKKWEFEISGDASASPPRVEIEAMAVS